MPDYTVRDPKTGRSITMRGPQPPTGDQIRRAFAQLPAPQMPAAAIDPSMPAPSRVTDQRPASPRDAVQAGIAAFDRQRADVDAMELAWGHAGPTRVKEGLIDIGRGNIARGAHDALIGSAITAAPMIAPGVARMFMAAPVATTLAAGGGVVGGTAGATVAEGTAKALGASEDQAALAGDVGGILAGGAGAKLMQGVPRRASAWRQTRRTRQGLQATATFRQAVPPSASAPYTPEQFDRALPYFDEAHAAKPIQTVEGLRDAADDIIGAIETRVGEAVSANPNDLIRVNVLDRVRGVLARSPRGGATQAGLRELDDLGLNRDLTIRDAERIRRQLNAENKAMLKRNNYDVATARQADPGFAAREEAAAALRDGIYHQLEARGINGIRALRQDEGAVISIRNAAERQIFNAERRVSGTGTQGPTRRAIADAARLVPKVGGYIADAVAKPNQTRDQLINRAFEIRIPAAPRQMPAIPARPSIRGLLPAPAHAMGPGYGYVVAKGPDGRPVLVPAGDRP